MRLGELMGREVVDRDGRSIGRVHDVRLVQDGPLLGFDAAFRVHGLIAGPGSVATRQGYGQAGVRGPWLVRVLLERRRAWFVPWARTTFDGTTIRFDGTHAELEAPAPLSADPRDLP
jgi:hypothetical protein